jgi:hypothetical protein
MELASADLLAMTDEQLSALLNHLGFTPPGTRDKAIELVMKIALSAQDN